MTTVLKRDGKKVDFNKEKISSAILKAMNSPSGIYVKGQP
ncbi:MAG: ATP cone domain-containing protein, partial [Anaerococcus sp.]